MNGKKLNNFLIMGFVILLFFISPFFVKPVSSSPLSNQETPKERYGHRMVYIPEDESIILFGGERAYQSDTLYRSVWHFDLASRIWQNLTTANNPSPRMTHGFAYDTITQKIILFGGLSTENYSRLADTWILDLDSSAWTNIPTTNHPAARNSMGFYFDPEIQAVVLFGGYSQYDTRLDDTWLFFTNNNSWVEVELTTHPSARYGHQMVYDSNENVGLLFGGKAGTYTDETWQFNSANLEWEQIITTHTPTKRYWHTMAYVEQNQKVYIFGGRNDGFAGQSINHTGIYNTIDKDWEEIIFTDGPTSRMFTNMVYHEQSQYIFLYGGLKNYDSNSFGDSWLFDINKQEWIKPDYTTSEIAGYQGIIPLIVSYTVILGIIVWVVRKNSCIKGI